MICNSSESSIDSRVSTTADPYRSSSVQTFKRAVAGNNGPAFVYLHVLFQSTISLLHRPVLLRKFSNEIPAIMPEPSFAPIASSASRTIADILSLADALDDKCILANPYLDQLVLPAGRAFLGEREVTREALKRAGYTPGNSRPPSRSGRPMNNNRTNLLLVTRSWAETNLATCQSVLDKIAVFWGGASWPARALEQEAAGATEDVDPDAADEDAQNAPIHDVEMVLKWAKARVKQAKAAGRGSSRAAADQSKADDAAESGGVQMSSTSEGNASATGGIDNARGFGISGTLDAEADIDIEALLSTWGAQDFTLAQTPGAPGVMTPHNRTFQTATGGTPWQGIHAPPIDLSTAKLEELFGQTAQNGDDVFPLDLPDAEFSSAAATSALFGPMLFSQDFQNLIPHQ